MNATALEVTRVWILEDHQVFAKQVRRLLAGEADIDCPYHFSHPDELFDKLRFTNDKPDVLLLDPASEAAFQ